MKNIINFILVIYFIFAPSASMAQEKKAGMSFIYSSQLSVVCGAAMGASSQFSCTPMSYSLWAHSAGSAVYLAAELFTARKLNQAHKMNAESLKKSEESLKGIDLESLKASLKAEQDKADAAHARKKWLTAVSIAYSTSLILATIEAMCEGGFRYTVYGTAVCAGLPFASCRPDTGKVAAITTGVITAFSAFINNGGFDKNSNAWLSSLAMGASAGMMANTFSSQISMLSQGIPRAIVIGSTDAMAITSKIQVGNVAKVLDENVETLKKLIAKYEKETNPEGGVLEEGAQSPEAYKNEKARIQAESNFKLLSKSNEIDGEKKCQSLSGDKFNLMSGCQSPLRIPTLNYGPSFNVDLAKSLDSSIKMANAISSGDFQNAQLYAGELSNMSHRINKMKQDVLKEMDKYLKSKGEKKTFDQLVEGHLKSQEDAIMASMEKGGADLNSFKNSLASDKKESLKENENIPKHISANHEQVPVQENIFTARSEATTLTDEVAKNEAAKNQFESFSLGDADIGKDKGENIFDLLSKRYLMSYPKVLKKNKFLPASNP